MMNAHKYFIKVAKYAINLNYIHFTDKLNDKCFVCLVKFFHAKYIFSHD